MTKHMRTVFRLNQKINWFPGHMAIAKKQMNAQLNAIDIIVEVRDARIPITSANPELDATFNASKPRLIVFNKSDLANPNMQQHVQAHFEKHHQTTGNNESPPKGCIFTSVLERRKISSILQWCNQHSRAQFKSTAGTMIMVVGVPNVGKSSLINEFRAISTSQKLSKGRKRAMVGPTPGVTLRTDIIQVNQSPAIYVVDTPGVMLPNVKDQEAGLKLALTGAIKDDIIGKEVLADYMLYTLNQRVSKGYVQTLGLSESTDDIEQLFASIQQRCGGAGKDRDTQSRLAAEYLLAAYRRGDFGRFTLDHLKP